MRRESRVVHGHRRSYLVAGAGPAVLLLHGMGDSSRTWEQVIPLLAREHLVIAPDLLGHGESDKPRADYSLGGFANGMRDLLTLLDVDRATIVGHSLGGGVAMQLAYQYPERVERLVLVASGGLGAEVVPLLRLAALPGAAAALGASLQLPNRLAVQTGLRAARRLGLIPEVDAQELERIWLGLRDRATRTAFLRTLRGVVDVHGQTITSRDRAYLTAGIPTMLIWGDRDPVLPVAHVHAVADAMPQARVEVMSGAGHAPHRADAQQFASLLAQFTGTTAPASHDPAAWRALLLGAPQDAQARSSRVQHLTPPPALSSSDRSTGTGT